MGKCGRAVAGLLVVAASAIVVLGSAAARSLERLEAKDLLGPSELFVLAAARLLMRQFKEAVRLSDIALASDPSDYWPSLCKALALFQKGRKDDAAPILAELVSKDHPYARILTAFCSQQFSSSARLSNTRQSR